VLLGACGDDSIEESDETESSQTDTSGEAAEAEFPDVIAAEALRGQGNSLSIEATISSPYDSPERYADAFRVLDTDGDELGVRELAHDHATEQPFSRSLDGIEIANAAAVTIQARDSENGWGGATVSIDIPATAGE
jgi:hypothetical protein